MSGTLNLANEPPAPGPRLLVLRLRAGQKCSFVILSETIIGIWTHWSGRASNPCFTPKEDCEGCKKGYPKRWKGYIHCIDKSAHRHVFLELTPMSATSLRGQIPGGSSLRGFSLSAERGRGDKARLAVLIEQYCPKISDLPQAIDPIPTLSELWGLKPDPERQYPGIWPEAM